MEQNVLTHKAIADMLGVSETTVKSYRRKFPGCFPIAFSGKPISFTQDAAQVAIKIRDYFATGMSVDEVSVRLAEEFPWYKAEGKTEKRIDESNGAHAAHLSAGVSTMAKSMVALTSQQNAILERMQNIEAVLEEIGLSSAESKGIQERKEMAREKSLQLEKRLTQLDHLTQDLAANLEGLSEQFKSLLQLKQSSLVQAASDASTELSSQKTNKTLPFPSQTSTETEYIPDAREDITGPKEPSRSFLSMPLVVQHRDGSYMSVVGRQKGRLSLQDLKALLMAQLGPSQYTMRFSPEDEGWLLTLQVNKPEGEQLLECSLLERTTKTGLALIELVKLKMNNHSVHASELTPFLEGLFS